MTDRFKALVTGGCGYIGSHTVRQLIETGYDVVVVDNLSTGFREAIGDSPFYCGDVGDKSFLRRVFSEHAFDAVFHFAASIVAPKSVSTPIEYYHNNVAAMINLLWVTIEHRVPKFIFSSTAAVYGESDQAVVSEETPPNPQNPYGRSKLVGEWMIQDAARSHGLKYVILRYFNVAGADPKGRMGQRTQDATHLIKVACEAALGERPYASIFGTDYQTSDGTGVRDYIHVEDLARAHVAASEHLIRGGSSAILNCGYGHGHSVRQVFNAVQRVSGVAFPIIEEPRRPGDIGQLVADNKRISKMLDWKPRYDDLELIIKHALDWEKRKER